MRPLNRQRNKAASEVSTNVRAFSHKYTFCLGDDLAIGREGAAHSDGIRFASTVSASAKHELTLFDQLLPRAKYVGEIGLDGAPEHRASWTVQLAVFEHILKSCASAGGRVMTIHSRRAAGLVLNLLESNPGAGTPILHWFSGTKKNLQRAIDLGCWFSVGPPMLDSANGRRLFELMPKERVLTESDGPFAQMEARSLTPWDVSKAYELIGTAWDSELARHVKYFSRI